MARLCLALLRNLDDTIKVLDKSVRNFDGESYYNRRNSNVSPVFVCGGRTDVSVISTIPPNLPLIREAYGKTLSCIASQ